MERVPLVDLRIQNEQIREEVQQGVAHALMTSTFDRGPAVNAFEKRYASLTRSRHCIGVGSGMDAVELSLRALDVGPGDEVILPTNARIDTALAIARTGATPVLVDCDEEHHLIDPDEVLSAITKNTQAIVAVHSLGQMAPMRALSAIAEREGVALVEDAAEAQGATQAGVSAGAHGAAAATSFAPEMSLGAWGAAGAVTTNNDVIANALRALADRGVEGRYPRIGFESRLDALQASVLLAKIGKLEHYNHQRTIAAAYYDEHLAKLTWVQRPSTAPGNEHVWHAYVVRVPERDRVLRALLESGVDAEAYPTPIHLSGRFASLGHGRGDFLVAERLAERALRLPLFPGIRAEQQDRVVQALRRIDGLLCSAA